MPVISLIPHAKNHRRVHSIPPVPMPFPSLIILFHIRYSMTAIHASVYSHAIVRGPCKCPCYNSSLRALISTLIWPSRFCCFSYLLYSSWHVMSAMLYLFSVSVHILDDFRSLQQQGTRQNAIGGKRSMKLTTSNLRLHIRHVCRRQHMPLLWRCTPGRT